MEPVEPGTLSEARTRGRNLFVPSVGWLVDLFEAVRRHAILPKLPPSKGWGGVGRKLVGVRRHIGEVGVCAKKVELGGRDVVPNLLGLGPAGPPGAGDVGTRRAVLLVKGGVTRLPKD